MCGTHNFSGIYMSLSKKIIALAVLLALQPAYTEACATENKTTPVHGVVEVPSAPDGDTIKIKLPQGVYSVRLVGIDCYETSKIHRAYKQAYENSLTIEEVIKKGNEATDYLVEILKKSNNRVKFQLEGIDKYGRFLGVIYDKNGNNINKMMMNNGMCLPYEYQGSH